MKPGADEGAHLVQRQKRRWRLFVLGCLASLQLFYLSPFILDVFYLSVDNKESIFVYDASMKTNNEDIVNIDFF